MSKRELCLYFSLSVTVFAQFESFGYEPLKKSNKYAKFWRDPKSGAAKT
jgi:hypothetical protein